VSPFVALLSKRCKSTTQDLTNDVRLLELSGCVSGPVTPQIFSGLDRRVAKHPELWQEVLQNALSSSEMCPELTSLCLQAPLDEAIRQILSALLGNKQLVQVLENCLQENLGDFLIRSCYWWEEEKEDVDWPHLVQTIVSLPSKVGNIVEKDMPLFCGIEKYSSLLCYQLGYAMNFLSQAVKEQVPWKVHKLGHFFSKVLTNYGGCESVEIFFRVLIAACERDQNLLMVFRTVLFYLEGKACENALTILLLNKSAEKVLGKEMPQQWKNHILVVLPFLRCHPKSNLPINLIDTVAESLVQEYVDFVIKLVSLWSNKSAITHTPLDQQIYVSEMILRSAVHLKKIELEGEKRLALQREIMRGVPKRLEETSENKKMMGLLVAEKLMAILNPLAEPLKFEYNQKLDLIQHLTNLEIKLENIDLLENWLDTLEEQLDFQEALFNSRFRLKNMKLESTRLSEDTSSSQKLNSVVLDSDDDDENDEFEPYDMSNDKPQKASLPLFLREYLQLMIDKPEEVCLDHLPQIIKKQLPDDDPSMAIELLEALLNLDLSKENASFRSESIVSSIEIHPTEAVQHLGGLLMVQNKFPTQYLSCILKSIASAASNLFHGPQPSGESVKFEPPALPKNTRRFHSYRPPVNETKSKFSPVAASFLFPLLPALHNQKWCAELRMQLLATLAIIITCSANCPRVKKMSLALIEELIFARWPIQHEDSQVRSAAVRCLLMALVHLDVQGIFECCQRDEVHSLMLNMSRNDPDDECREWANRALTLLN